MIHNEFVVLLFLTSFLSSHGGLLGGKSFHSTKKPDSGSQRCAAKTDCGIPEKPLYDLKDCDAEYDYIIVGAGSSGSVLANRLSENEHVTVLLLEAGGPPPGISDIPAVAPTLWGSKEDWQYYTEPQKSSFYALKNQTSFWPRYRALGGCSSVNLMFYVRGNKLDYDKWAKNGATGWSYNEVLPYFLKSEDQQDPTLIKNKKYHGCGGYQTVSPLRYITPSGEALIRAAKSRFGLEELDYNGERQTGISRLQLTQVNGLRSSTEKAFLRPVVSRKNLHILTYAHVKKILFNGNVAVSVEFDHNNVSKSVKARKEICLCAGAIGTPQILLLSGVGPKEHLQEMGIPVVADLPVGLNLHDHFLVFGNSYVVNDSAGIVYSRDQTYQNFGLLLDGKGKLTLPGAGEILAFFNSKYQNESKDWPDIEIISLATTLAPPIYTLNENVAKFIDQFINIDVLGLFPFLLQPKSRGVMKLKSLNPYDHPMIDPEYLKEEEDLLVLVEALKIIDSWFEAPEMREIILQRVLPANLGCEKYEPKSDELYKCQVKTHSSTGFHPAGTCKMGNPKDNTTVTDPEARVKGLKGLRAADASIMPSIMAGHPHAACVMIAEKVADIMKSN